ncbi:MAG TPA: alpha/beta fold hydrolase [Gemmatimonadota bacterium]|nr:alpha/beta fold hydrolase [Gemmatimonadota bacterium]
MRIETPDGDFLDLDQDGGEGPPDVLVLHGLGGSSSSGYVLELLGQLRDRGLRGAALNFRSCSGEPNRTRRFYHAGATGDPRFVIRQLVERRGGRPVGAVGFSLGGNILLRLLEEEGTDARRSVAAAVTVSVPFDLAAGARRLDRLPGSLYGASFLRSLRDAVERKARTHGLDLPLEDARRARTLREFDEAVTAPVHGFRSAADYYRRASAGPELHRIRTPALVLQARDDPFLPAGAVPERALASNPWITPALPTTGGHVGFVEGPAPWKASFWAERQAARFLAVALASAP